MPKARDAAREVAEEVEPVVRSARVISFRPELNDRDLAAEKDLLEEIREAAAIRNAQYKQRVAQYQPPRTKRTSGVLPLFCYLMGSIIKKNR